MTYIEGVPDRYSEIVAVELGRDLLRLGIDPFIVKLVGEGNAQRLWERHAGDGPDACPYDFAHTKHWCGYEECRET